MAIIEPTVVNCSLNNGHGPCGQICNQLNQTVQCACEAGFILLYDHLHCLGKLLAFCYVITFKQEYNDLDFVTRLSS